MPSDLKKEKRSVNDDLRDAVAFLIGATLDVLCTVLVILKTPMYVNTIARLRVDPY